MCTSLLQNLLERDLRVEGKLLCLIDGGKGIRKALNDVLGDAALVQRCQVHKRRNVMGHLSESRQSYVRHALYEAYNSKSAKTAKKRLCVLKDWLERNGEEGAAASLGEGLDETLTIMKFGLGPTLRRSLSTTNAIENMLGTVRRVSRNVKRWREGDMIRRWAALGISTAEAKFRRIKGHRELPALVQALRMKTTTLDEMTEAA